VHRNLIPLLAAPLFAAPLPFAEHTVATGLKGGYQVVIADLNHDGKPDLIALASGMTELVWYENPGWERHVIAGGLSGMINCAAVDVPGDPIPEIVLASGFSMRAAESAGIVSVLRHKGDPRDPWTIQEIDRLPASHRIRVADIDGSGRKVVINAPLTGATAEAPDYRGHNALVYYRPGEWKRHEIPPGNEGLVHGLYIIDWDGDGRDEILTAGFDGIHLFKFGADEKWARTLISRGDPDPWPKSGASDIAVGRLGRERFLATIEPWHGNKVAIYRLRGGAWHRAEIDDSLVDGHTIQTADLDGDGNDEVIAGFRGDGHKVYVYKPVGQALPPASPGLAADTAGQRWSRQTLDDGGMAAAACAVADLDGDGRPDIACIGSATANLKWYENRGVASRR
jgi:hypothetical protein